MITIGPIIGVYELLLKQEEERKKLKDKEKEKKKTNEINFKFFLDKEMNK